MKTIATSAEREARYDAATAWSREHFPICARLEDWLAAYQRMEAAHQAERQRAAAELGRIVGREVRSLEGLVKDRRLRPTG